MKKKTGLMKYYDGLPETTSPKTEFVERAAKVCGVSETTVRNWVKGNTAPADSAHVKKLSKLTGINENNLFQ